MMSVLPGRLLASAAALVAVCLGSLASAAVITVQQNGSGNFTTIQAALNFAANGDTILVGPGSYAEFLDTGGKSVTLRGINGFTQTIVDPNGADGTLLTIAGGTLLIEQMSFRNGRNASMGAISASATVTFDSCRFLGGLASQGAALNIASSNVTFTNNQFLSNQASSVGGAIKADNSVLAFSNCAFSTNQCTGTQGGALRLDTCTVTFTNSSFTENSISGGGEGGAAYLVGSTATISQCTFSQNSITGGGSGGALRLQNGSASIGGTVFTDNSVTGGSTALGGAVCSVGVSGTWTGMTLTGNRVDCGGTTQGGDLYVSGGNIAAIANSTFSGSRALNGTALGGSILLTGGARPTISNSAFTDCQAQTNGTARGGAIYLDNNSNAMLLSLDFTNCRVPNGPGADEGGALYVTGSIPLIDDCEFVGCSSNDGGGAIFLSNLSSATILSSVFRQNSGSAGGAIVAVGQSSPLIAGTVFTSNGASGSNGGAMYIEDSAPSFAACLFQQNGNQAIRIVGNGGYVPLVGGSTFCGNAGDISGPWYSAGNNIFVANCGGDCDGNGLDDAYEIATGLVPDCNKNGVPDDCEIEANPLLDCNGSGVLDSCEGGTFSDCDGSGVPDECKPDCNDNGLPDSCEILAGLGSDCNGNNVLDACEIADGSATDCDASGLPDECKEDCDADGLPDVCEIASDPLLDCDEDGVLDSCSIEADPSLDVNRNGYLDSCEGLSLTGIEIEVVPITGVCYRIYATFDDPGSRLVAVYGSPADGSMIFTTAVGFYQHPLGGNLASLRPCDPNGNQPALAYDSFLTVGGNCAANSSEESVGINFSGFNSGNTLIVNDGIVFVDPDGTQGFAGPSRRVLVAQLTTRSGVLPQGQFNLAGFNPDGSEFQAYGMTWGEPTLVDCNGNGQQDATDIGSGVSLDCNRDGIPDDCQFDDPQVDCNGNGVPDACDIASGASQDLDANGIPDECQCQGDVDGDGVVDVYDLIEVITAWGATGPNAADLNADGVVDVIDLTLVVAGFGACL